MGLRTAADVQEEYNILRAAWLKAVEAEKLEHSTLGGTSRRLERSTSESLKKQMKELSDEHSRLSRGSSMKSYNLIPGDE
jgi:hypothetical protein